MESASVGELFRKSSYSDNGEGNCVELGHGQDAILVRDTKDRDRGSLKFPPHAWSTFTATLR